MELPDPPFRADGNATHNLIGWLSPVHYSCPITGFRLFARHSGVTWQSVYPYVEGPGVNLTSPFDPSLTASWAMQHFVDCRESATLEAGWMGCVMVAYSVGKYAHVLRKFRDIFIGF